MGNLQLAAASRPGMDDLQWSHSWYRQCIADVASASQLSYMQFGLKLVAFICNCQPTQQHSHPVLIEHANARCGKGAVTTAQGGACFETSCQALVALLHQPTPATRKL